MTLDQLHDFLLWNLILNYGVLLLWFGMLVFARDTVYRLHKRWFQLTPQAFDTLHYGGMALYKVGILLFNLAPLLALCLIR
jgi:hypothetical protein